MYMTVNTITNIRTNTTGELRLVLRPEILNMRENFRDSLTRRVNYNISELPYVNDITVTQTIDFDGIIEINNSTSSERRIELMRSIINRENINDNSAFFIATSSNQVRTYLHDLLIRSASNFNINEIDLYRVGNLLLYTIANMHEEGLFIRDIVQHLREHMVMYNTNQILNILQNHIPIYNDYLESLSLATNSQLDERCEEFYQQVDERIALNRRRVLYAGLGLVGSMALTSIGLPPLGGIIARTVANVSSNSSMNSNEVIRLRDVWDASLKKLLDIIEK